MQLTVYRNDDIVSDFDLGEETILSTDGKVEYFIGRSLDCHILLDDPQVSRYHALLIRTLTSWEIVKHTETAFLLVNNQNTDRKILTDGDQIIIGPFQVKIKLGLADLRNNEQKFEEFRPQSELNAENINGPSQPLSQAPTEDDFAPAPNLDLQAPEDILVSSADMPSEVEETSVLSKEEQSFDDLGSLGDQNNDGDNSEDSESAGFGDSSEQSGEGNEYDSAFGSGDLSVPSEENGFQEDIGNQTQLVDSFAQYRLKIFGEFAPYDEYMLQEGDNFIGRQQQKCQIVLKDEEVSTVHAVVRKKNAEIFLEDLNSSNGTILNGSRINKSPIVGGDEFIIGSTTFTVEVISSLLASQKNNLMPVEENQVVEIEEIVEEEVDFNTESHGNTAPTSKSLFSKDALKDPQKRKKLIYVVVGLLLLLLLLDEEPEQTAKPGDGKTGATSATTTSGTPVANVSGTPGAGETNKGKRELTPEESEYVKAAYNKARDLYEQGLYSEAEIEINKVFSVSDYKYKEAEQLKNLIIEGYQRLKAEEERKQKEEDDKKRKEAIEGLLVKAREAVEKKDEALAEGLFSKILELDPEQPDVGLLRMELEAWKKEQDRLKTEEASRQGYRISKENKFNEAKGPYLQRKWYLSISTLEKFINNFDADRDPGIQKIMTKEIEEKLESMRTEAAAMLTESRENLKSEVDPLLASARSLKEGQDLKGAYESYMKILVIWPACIEALNETQEINENLRLRAQRIYREAVIYESLNLSKDAEEKFQEVLQVAPMESEYYTKSKNKLKRYYK